MSIVDKIELFFFHKQLKIFVEKFRNCSILIIHATITVEYRLFHKTFGQVQNYNFKGRFQSITELAYHTF